MKIIDFITDIFFPKFCINCQQEGEYLCQDCFSLIDFIPPYISIPIPQNLSEIICACSYENFVIKKLIRKFKYEPFIKELAIPLASLIIHHLKFNCKQQQLEFLKNGVLIPIPLSKKKLKKRGFNQAEEIAKELSLFLNVPLFNDVLFKIKENISQTELSKTEREKNVKNVFLCKRPDKIKDRKIILVDDVYTTGSTISEAGYVLKKTGAKEIWGIVLAKE